MRILSKTYVAATALALAALSCARYLPWRNEIPAAEVNLAFKLERNLIALHSVRLDNREGRFILGTAAPKTVIDPRFSQKTSAMLQLSENETFRVHPSALDLGGVADAIIGSEPWRSSAITIDYQTGLLTFQKEGIHTGYMKIYRYEDAPTIYVNVDGRNVPAIVDTANADTITLPRAERGRGTAHVRIGDTNFGTIDVAYANIARARVGNRLLSRFMVTIDYKKRMVGLWRDPRIGLVTP
jgi:hypothetical protein